MDLSKHWLYTHAGCLDGVGSSVLFRHAGGRKDHVRWFSPGHVDEDIAERSSFRDPNQPILLVDLAPGSMEMAERLAHRGNFVVIDHHKTAERFAGRFGFKISVGNQACGTELFREWLVEVMRMEKFDAPCYRNMAAAIDDHDRWINQIPLGKELVTFSSFVGAFEVEDLLMDVDDRFGEGFDRFWLPSERYLLDTLKKREERRHKSLLKKFVVRKRCYQGREIAIGYLVSDEPNTSSLLNAYLLEHPEVDLACQFSVELGKASLRSRDRVDCGQFGKDLGIEAGGGHKNAGGHPLPDGLVDLVIDAVHGKDER